MPGKSHLRGAGGQLEDYCGRAVEIQLDGGVVSSSQDTLQEGAVARQ